jgi:Nup85 Nucleoporin
MQSRDNEESMMSTEEEDEDVLGIPGLGTDSTFNQFEASTLSQKSFFKSTMGGHSHPHSRSQPRKKVSMPKPSQLPRKGNEDVIPGIARNLTSQSSVAFLEEPEDLIIHSEEAMQVLAEQTRGDPRGEPAAEKTTESVARLIQFWRKFIHPDTPSLSNARIGPSDSASGLEKANFMASLLLMLHHRPPVAEPNTKKASNRSLLSTSQKFAPVPLVLLEWLDNYHLSYSNQLQVILSASPNCSSHDYFWDILRSLVMRGKLRQVIHLLGEADFQYAVTAKDDGAEKPGYHGSQLQAVHSMVNRARQVLGGCPALDGHWETTDDEWDLYRKCVSAEIEHLAELAEDDLDEDEDDDEFRADNFGIRRPGGTLMKSMRKPGNRLPLTIYQNLKTMYNILLGSVEEIMNQSQDWLEAATSLTVWWDGSEQDDITTWSKNVSRSNIPGVSASDDPYLSRLSAAFLCVTDPEDAKSLQINTMSSAEVGLGAVLQGDHTSVLRILRTLSLPLASVVAMTGSSAGWMNSTSRVRPSQLDPEDLMVLSYAAPPSGVSKDDVLSEYAEALFDKPELRGSNGTVVEGWELALSVASRFDNVAHIRSTTSDFLDRLDLNSQQRMDKLVGLCSALGLEEEAQKVCEKFADHLVNNTTEYGTALLCYARSHSSNKLRQLMDLLVSYCLVQSKAYPPEDEMDDNLSALVASPKAALAGLVDVDPEAADMLQFYLVGYACIRRFYNLRDEEITTATNKTKPANRPIARKRLAAKALMAAINSAADSIYGGLYDAERQSAIQVDGLLTLLGEATAFLAGNSNEKTTLNTTQLYALLAAIEDLQTVNPRIYDATEECLQAALRQFHGSRPPSPHAMLKKSMSSGTNSNFSFSLMGSEMLAGSGTSAGGKSVGSAVLVGKEDVEKGWDWRVRFKDRGVTGKDVLRFLRVGIARELSVAELDGEQT